MWITQKSFFIFTIEFVLFIEQNKFENIKESFTKFSGLLGKNISEVEKKLIIYILGIFTVK